jgi:hypothetical protein
MEHIKFIKSGLNSKTASIRLTKIMGGGTAKKKTKKSSITFFKMLTYSCQLRQIIFTKQILKWYLIFSDGKYETYSLLFAESDSP